MVLNDYYVGAYWKVRMLTLLEYANQVKGFLNQLQTLHPVFGGLYYVGNKPNSEVKLTSDLSNLDDLIVKFSWDPKGKYENANLDGTPSWESTHSRGYRMVFNNGKSAKEGGVTISISVGMYSIWLNNAVIIEFPANDPGFPIEFSSYELIEKIFKLTVNFWRPEAALYTSYKFNEKVSYGSNEDFTTWQIGSLTYLDNPEVVKELPLGVDCQLLETGGPMIITLKETLSAENIEHVTKAISIRDALANKGLLNQRQYS